MKQQSDPDIVFLYSTIFRLCSLKECRRFFGDLLTEKELREISRRLAAARMLARGRSYRFIEHETGLSSRTIARVARKMKEGKGGFSLARRQTQKALNDASVIESRKDV